MLFSCLKISAGKWDFVGLSILDPATDYSISATCEHQLDTEADQGLSFDSEPADKEPKN